MADVLAHGLGPLSHGPGAWLPAVAAGAVPAVLYLSAARRPRRGAPWSPARAAAFLVGCTALGVSLSPPLAAPGDPSLTLHMTQHLLLAMVAPAGMALGAPITLALSAASPQVARAVRRYLGSPVLRLPANLALLVVVGAVGPAVLYLTPAHAAVEGSRLAHHLVHLHFFASGYLFAWVVAGGDPLPGRPSVAVRATALVVAGGAHDVVAKRLYAGAGDLPPGAGLVARDVEVAAQTMYWGGHAVTLALAVALFSRWYRSRPRTAPTSGVVGAARTDPATGVRGRTAPGAAPG